MHPTARHENGPASLAGNGPALVTRKGRQTRTCACSGPILARDDLRGGVGHPTFHRSPEAVAFVRDHGPGRHGRRSTTTRNLPLRTDFWGVPADSGVDLTDSHNVLLGCNRWGEQQRSAHCRPRAQSKGRTSGRRINGTLLGCRNDASVPPDCAELGPAGSLSGWTCGLKAVS